MKKKSTLDLTSVEYEADCWDTAIAHMKKQVEERHRQLAVKVKKVREAAEEYFNEDKGPV